MFDHITIRVPDLAIARRSLGAVLDALEIEETASTPSLAVWGNFAITQDDDEHPIARRVHVAFIAPTPAHVDRFARAGIDIGLVDDGPAGPRPDYAGDYYAAFLKDPAGNSFEAVHRDGARPRGNVDHVAIRVNDVEASAAFYSTIGPAAGLTPRRQTADHATFSVGSSDGSFILIAGEPTENIHIAFSGADDDVRQFHARATTAGYRSNGEPGERPRYHPGYYSAFVLDPDGNNIEVVDHHREVSAELEWHVFTATRPGLSRDLPPGYESLMWVANSATLIYGERDAVLVDTFLTVEQGVQLADEIAATGKNLTYIYVTHGHGDHFFGINALKERFPNLRAVATSSVVDRMAGQLEPELMDDFWRRLFPGQISDDPGMAESLDGASIELEGHALIPIATGFTDTADSTSLHVPSLGLIAAGDVVYNGIHPFLGETNPQSRLEWIDALDKLDRLEPRAVVAGHKIPDHEDDPRNIAETRQYLRDFIRLDQTTDSPRALFDAMIELYPDRANPGSLWGGANAAKKDAGNGSPGTATAAVRNDPTR